MKINNPIKLTILLLISFLSNTSLIAQWTGDTFENAKSKGSAKWVLTYSDTPGLVSKSASGQLTGVCVDLMNNFKSFVEEKEGIQVTISYQVKDSEDYAQFLSSVKSSQGGVFGLGNTTITTNLKEEYNVSPPYIGNVSIMLTDHSVATLMNIEDVAIKFSNMTAVAVKNSASDIQLSRIKAKYFPTLKIEYVKSFSAAMDAVILNSKKFTSVDFVYYFDAIKTRKPVKRHPGGDTKTEELGIIMPISNDWSPLLSEFMQSGFLTSVDYKKIVANNLGQSAIKFFNSIK